MWRAYEIARQALTERIDTSTATFKVGIFRLGALRFAIVWHEEGARNRLVKIATIEGIEAVPPPTFELT
jgi:hypothetical protein